LKKTVGNATILHARVHIFTPHGDVPDDTGLRLLVLPPELGTPARKTASLLKPSRSLAKTARSRAIAATALFASDHGALSVSTTQRASRSHGVRLSRT
jgi:hypothetical protein